MTESPAGQLDGTPVSVGRPGPPYGVGEVLDGLLVSLGDVVSPDGRADDGADGVTDPDVFLGAVVDGGVVDGVGLVRAGACVAGAVGAGAPPVPGAPEEVSGRT